MKKTHKVFIILTAIILTSFLFIKNYLKPTELVYSGTIKTKEIKSPVNVYFDEYGVPSVFAENDEDMFFVAGYIGARDRLFQMAFLKYAYRDSLQKH